MPSLMQVSDSWEVTLQCLPGARLVVARGEAVAFISTVFDGKVLPTRPCSAQLPFHISNPQVIVANVEVSEGNVAFSTIKLSHKVDFQKLQSALLHTDAIDFAGYWGERPTVHSSVSKRFPAW